MCTLSQVVNGIKEYFEHELVAKIPGLGKWLIGAAISMTLDNADHVFMELKENSLIKAMGIIGPDEMIDIEKLYQHILAQAQNSTASINMPLIGVVTFKAEDVEKIYSYIKMY